MRRFARVAIGAAGAAGTAHARSVVGTLGARFRMRDALTPRENVMTETWSEKAEREYDLLTDLLWQELHPPCKHEHVSGILDTNGNGEFTCHDCGHVQRVGRGISVPT